MDNTKVTDHHAIIPTGESPSRLSADEATVYQMVVTRFVEAFSPNSEEERMQLRFADGTNTFTWKAYRQISLVWKAVQKGKEVEAEKKEDGDEQILPSLSNLTEGEVCGILLSEDSIRDLISSGCTPILKGLTSKAGKKFNVRLVLKDDYTTTFEFEQNKKRK